MNAEASGLPTRSDQLLPPKSISPTGQGGCRHRPWWLSLNTWLADVLANHYEEARERADFLLAAGLLQVTGCIETETLGAKKTRFRGRQVAAYRFIYCMLRQTVASYDDVVRHRCNNRRCINPEHLEIGSRGDNMMDERDFGANGVDFDLL